MKNLTILLIIFGVFTVNSCIQNNEVDKTINISPDIVIIEGEIENYQGEVKTVSLIHFNAVLRSGSDEVFSIDSLGKFKLSFELIMPTHTNLISIGRYSTYLYLVPGSSYNLTLKETGEFDLKGYNAFLHDQFIDLNVAVGNNFRRYDQERMNLVRKNSASYEEYCYFLKAGSDKKVDFINKYCDSTGIASSIRTMVISDAIYEQAWARILYRMIFYDDHVTFRDSLPGNFYQDILSEFPINKPSAASSRYYMDYVGNLKSSIIEKSERDTSSFSAYLREYSTFNNREIFLLTRAYAQDTSIFRMNEYQQFIKNNQLSEVSRGYSIAYSIPFLIDAIASFEPGFGRDILMSQCIEEYSFQGAYHSISETIWQKIEPLFYHKEIFDILRRLDNINKAKQSKTLDQNANLRDPILAESSKEFYKQLFEKYKGKYVYVDFWATWCGSCRSEIPVSKLLQNEFEREDIVFLYLCCASDYTSWNNYIKSEQLTGEHYFISNDELNYLSAFFDISGYPTYAVINPKGKLIDNNPPRPSSQNIIEYLNDLIH